MAWAEAVAAPLAEPVAEAIELPVAAAVPEPETEPVDEAVEAPVADPSPEPDDKPVAVLEVVPPPVPVLSSMYMIHERLRLVGIV